MRRALSVLLLTVSVLAPGPAAAQQYPAKPVLVLVPLAAGSASDVAVRTLTERLSSALRQQFVVENQPGAAGLIGTERAAKAPADGYTIAALNSSITTMLPAIHSKVGYDPLSSFSPITMLVTIPTGLIVHPTVPARSVKELIALSKAQPRQLLYSSGGVGSPQHVAMEIFKSSAGVDIVHVPYKGAVPATTDLMGGHVHVMFNGLAFPLPHIKTGKLRALATTGAKRSALLPDVPTVQEGGVPGYVFEQWLALFAPARTPPEIVARLNSEAVKILASPDVRDLLLKSALDAQGGPPENVTQALKDDLPKMAKIIRQLGIKPE